MVELILSIIGLVIAVCAYVAGVAVGKIAASRESGSSGRDVRVSRENIVGGASRRSVKAS